MKAAIGPRVAMIDRVPIHFLGNVSITMPAISGLNMAKVRIQTASMV